MKLLSLSDFGFIRWVKWYVRKNWFQIRYRNQNVHIGYFAYVRQSKLGQKAFIKDFVSINQSSIGDFTYVSSHSVIANSVVGKFCSIGKYVQCGLPHHPTNFVSTHPIFYSRLKQIGITFSEEQNFKEKYDTEIGNDVWIGTGAMIVGGVSIGDGAIIGAGALVLKDVEPYSIVGGIPAKHLRFRFDNHIIEKLLRIKWWNMDPKLLQKSHKDFTDPERFIQRFGKD